MPAKPFLSYFSQLLHKIEVAGNKLPHPTTLFIVFCLVILLVSALAAGLNLSAVHPISGDTVAAVNLISTTGLHNILTQTVSNFVQFAPVGTVLIAILGLGIAERSGLLACLMQQLILKTPPQMISFAVVTIGVLSSLAADAGYVVLIPLAAMLYSNCGRPPMLGIAAAFAGVSGGFSANLMVGPVDAILAGISSEAVQLVVTDYQVSALGNYYFIAASTLLIAVVGTWVTEKIVAPTLNQHATETQPITKLTQADKRGLLAVLGFTVLSAGLIGWGLLPEQGVLRDAATGSIQSSPFIKGIVTVIALYAGVCGIIFGKISGSFSRFDDTIASMEATMATMAGYLVLMFFAAQFVSYFSWSQLGAILAIKGAAGLQQLDLGPTPLLLLFILLAASLNLMIGSASAKWALLAPIFVPMLYLIGISPEATQMAFRIGDSSTNIITPLMPYFGVVVAFAQQYDKQAGIGTIMAAMLPYSLAFLLSWSVFLAVWIGFDMPFGPGVTATIGN